MKCPIIINVHYLFKNARYFSWFRDIFKMSVLYFENDLRVIHTENVTTTSMPTRNPLQAETWSDGGGGVG